MSKYKKVLAALAMGGFFTASAPAAQADDLTLCWAAWDPANALVELSKEFESQSGHKMNFEFVPWPNFCRPHAQRTELWRQTLRFADR